MLGMLRYVGYARAYIISRNLKSDRILKLIIQIPCYNEAGTLGIALAVLPREVPGFSSVEWLIIDDGVICTEWKRFRKVDFVWLKTQLRYPVVVDGRNLYEPEDLLDVGLRYFAVGRDETSAIAKIHKEMK